ncbi:uncharacterized protein LOC133795690 [Humulus lupulus]|uniref:uncharacterized protein LOC133795690 n=1 Tax=Humulus lupulus TaxID=3486 RepID=UPI002B4067A1|nr:uncharacterized protein LOC133795690 [Humulus lupulus]
MEKDVFIKLCDELEANYGFKGSKRMCALEILGMFLFTLGHGAGNRLTQERFQHSGETVSRYFNKVLDVLCHMSVDVLKPPDPEFKDVPEEILKDSRYMPHFKNCIGAIDGVHVNAVIPPEDQVPFVGRKGIPTQNVMAICNFDMQFIYAYAGWEGSAHDTRIFYTALRDSTSNFPKPPQGKYYLVDAGYPQITGFLGPYKGQRYHLPQFQRGSKPTVIKRHAKRDRHFEKIRDNPYYCVEDQTNIEDEDETARASNLNEMDNTRDLIAATFSHSTATAAFSHSTATAAFSHSTAVPNWP